MSLTNSSANNSTFQYSYPVVGSWQFYVMVTTPGAIIVVSIIIAILFPLLRFVLSKCKECDGSTRWLNDIRFLFVEHIFTFGFFFHILSSVSFILEILSFVSILQFIFALDGSIDETVESWRADFDLLLLVTGLLLLVVLVDVGFVFISNFPIIGYYVQLYISMKVQEKYTSLQGRYNVSIFALFTFAETVFDCGILAMEAEKSREVLGKGATALTVIAVVFMFLTIVAAISFFVTGNFLAGSLKYYVPYGILVTFLLVDFFMLLGCAGVSFSVGIGIDTVFLCTVVLLSIPLKLGDFIVSVVQDLGILKAEDP